MKFDNKNAWIIQWVMPFLLIPSFIWDSILYLFFIYRFYFRRDTSGHEERVRKIQEQVRRWRTEGQGRKMCTNRASWRSITQQNLGYKSKSYRVDIDLDHVLEIDEKSMTVTVEPMVCIGFLNRLLVANGYTLPIVPELDLLTIGGLIMGAGLESTSHKHGVFDELAEEYEIVTADGECLIADKVSQNVDLYYALSVSYGTLGFLTRLKLRIEPYKPYIKLTYRPTYSLDETVDVLDSEVHKKTGNDSVEGIMYNRNQAVIMTGEFLEKSEVEWDKVNRMGLWFKPWFYKHAETFIKKGETTEYIPTLDFHQRHNRPCFWLTPQWLPWAHHPVARFLIGWVLPINTQLLKLTKEKILGIDYLDHFILQDFIIPITQLKEAVKLSTEEADVWPVWMVPVRIEQQPGSMRPQARGGKVMYIDLGVYGHSFLPTYKGRDETLRIYEKFTMDHGGYQALYTETLMSREEFNEMFDRSLYEKVRNRLPLCNEAFPDVYQKVSRDGRKGIL